MLKKKRKGEKGEEGKVYQKQRTPEHPPDDRASDQMLAMDAKYARSRDLTIASHDCQVRHESE